MNPSEPWITRYRKLLICLAGLFLCALLPSFAMADSKRQHRVIALDPFDRFSITVGGKAVECGFIDSEWIAGKALSGDKFRTLEDLIRGKRKKLKKSPSDKRKKIQKGIRKTKQLLNLAKPVCAIGPGTIQPTPTPSQPNFDSNGNVTEAGKTLFEIPSNLSGNISRGLELVDGNCRGCHEERIGRTFTNIRSNISKPPMFFDEVRMPDQDLADIVAYLNRFRS